VRQRRHQGPRVGHETTRVRWYCDARSQKRRGAPSRRARNIRSRRSDVVRCQRRDSPTRTARPRLATAGPMTAIESSSSPGPRRADRVPSEPIVDLQLVRNAQPDAATGAVPATGHAAAGSLATRGARPRASAPERPSVGARRRASAARQRDESRRAGADSDRQRGAQIRQEVMGRHERRFEAEDQERKRWRPSQRSASCAAGAAPLAQKGPDAERTRSRLQFSSSGTLPTLQVPTKSSVRVRDEGAVRVVPRRQQEIRRRRHNRPPMR